MIPNRRTCFARSGIGCEVCRERMLLPTAVLAVIEVADSSLGRDRTTKLAIYAEAGLRCTSSYIPIPPKNRHFVGTCLVPGPFSAGATCKIPVIGRPNPAI